MGKHLGRPGWGTLRATDKKSGVGQVSEGRKEGKRPLHLGGKHPPVRDIRDLVFFRMAHLAAANDRLGQRWSQKHFQLRLSEWRVLGMVQALEPVGFGGIARALYIDRGQLSRLLKTLEKRGLVRITPDEADKRARHLETTPAGRELHDRMLRFVLEPNEVYVSALTREEVSTLMGILEKLQVFSDQNLERIGGKP